MVQAGIAAHCAFTVLLANAGTTAEFSALDGKGVDFKSDPLGQVARRRRDQRQHRASPFKAPCKQR